MLQIVYIQIVYDGKVNVQIVYYNVVVYRVAVKITIKVKIKIIITHKFAVGEYANINK